MCVGYCDSNILRVEECTPEEWMSCLIPSDRMGVFVKVPCVNILGVQKRQKGAESWHRFFTCDKCPMEFKLKAVFLPSPLSQVKQTPIGTKDFSKTELCVLD